jgi:hypothetical protein
MLPEGIREIREFAEQFMLEETEIHYLERYEDENGYERTRWELKERTKSFSLPVGQRELLRAQQAGIEVEARRFMPIDVDVTTEDTLYVNGRRWNVTGIPDLTEQLSAHTEVYLRRR